MQFTIFLFKLFFLIFLLFFYNNFVFGFSINNFVFFNKKECFSFIKSDKILFSRKPQMIISNDNFIGVFRENRFKIFYIVKSKDTLYSISKNSGYNYNELSKLNSIKKPYKIFVGQKIWMGDFFIDKNNCSIINTQNNVIKKHSSCELIFKTKLNIKNFLKYNAQLNKICLYCSNIPKKNSHTLKPQSFYFSNNWYWPVKNKYIKYFYHDRSDNTKIEISGVKGQPVFAASAGEVVCVTDEFKKYGRLIIIKHNKNYLSIYAFNNLVLVKEKDKVYEKQQISTMGLSSDTNLARLYFEIRYLGESINPLDILPKI